LGKIGRKSGATFPLVLIAALLGAMAIAGYFRFSPAPLLHQPELPTIISPIRAQTITGRASVIDGDTIEIHGTRIRLFGIDAPESDQSCVVQGKTSRCGQIASGALANKLGSQVVNCQPKDRDQYDRIVAVCSVGEEDINAWMVAQGWALAYRYYSNDYISQEEQASKSKIGVWQGDFTAPWDWRRGDRSQRSRPPANNLPRQSPPKDSHHAIYYRPGDLSGTR